MSQDEECTLLINVAIQIYANRISRLLTRTDVEYDEVLSVANSKASSSIELATKFVEELKIEGIIKR